MFYLDQKTFEEIDKLLTEHTNSKWFWQRWALAYMIVVKLRQRMRYTHEKYHKEQS